MAVHAPGMRQRFVAATAQLEDGTPVVSVMGDVDLATAPLLERTLVEVTEAGKGEVVVDLTGCSFLDAGGLRALVATRSRLKKLGPIARARPFESERDADISDHALRRVVRDLPLAGRGRPPQRQR